MGKQPALAASPVRGQRVGCSAERQAELLDAGACHGQWILVIFVMVVIAATYFGTLAVYGEWQVITPWIIAAVLIAVSLGIYISTKTSKAGSKIKEAYQIDDLT